MNATPRCPAATAVPAEYHVVREPRAVREVLRRAEEFAPSNALTSVVPLHPATLRILSAVGFALPPVLASATGERHRRVRSLVARFFTPERVAAARPLVARLTHERALAAADALAGGPVDLADAVIRHVPPAVAAALTGVASPPVDVLTRWSRHSLELFWGAPSPARQRELAESAAEFYAWLREQVTTATDERSLFATLRAAGLGVTEVCALGYFLVIAGHETTSLLVNTVFLRTLERPEVWRRIAAGADADGVVREVLATESSVHTWRRAATRSTRVGDADVAAGTPLLLELSGHHPDPPPPGAYGLAFGYGVHRCLGARLAEMEAVTMLETAARALPAVRLRDPAPPWLRLLSFQAPLSVPVAAAGHPAGR